MEFSISTFAGFIFGYFRRVLSRRGDIKFTFLPLNLTLILALVPFAWLPPFFYREISSTVV